MSLIQWTEKYDSVTGTYTTRTLTAGPSSMRPSQNHKRKDRLPEHDYGKYFPAKWPKSACPNHQKQYSYLNNVNEHYYGYK